jgi:hypothetical protein
MAIKFHKKEKLLLIEYSSYDGRDWVRFEFEADNDITILKTYIFKKEDLYDEEDESNEFDYDESSVLLIFGKLDIEEKYYEIEGRKLGIPYKIYFDKNITIYPYYFTCNGISIFRHIANVVTGDIKIGIENDDCIKIKTFERLVEKFPNSYELKLYAERRITSIIKDEFEKTKDAEKKYEKYMSKKYSKNDVIASDISKEFEKEKYNKIYQTLTEMLKNQEMYTEPVWQKQILEILTIIFPKYLYVLPEVPVNDYYNDKKRKIDFTLIDYNGNIDIIEIKRPYDKPILTDNTYRENYVPLRELSGTIMQIEKYLFHLTKGGKRSETLVNDYFHSKIHSSLNIKIINPSGIVIFGRDTSLNENQIADFEIIKRKYKNIIDIITYDDLLLRLKRIIEKYSL